MVFAVETEDVLQAWALPIENNIGVGGFDLAPAANPLTSGVGREGSLGCSTCIRTFAYYSGLYIYM